MDSRGRPNSRRNIAHRRISVGASALIACSVLTSCSSATLDTSTSSPSSVSPGGGTGSEPSSTTSDAPRIAEPSTSTPTPSPSTTRPVSREDPVAGEALGAVQDGTYFGLLRGAAAPEREVDIDLAQLFFGNQAVSAALNDQVVPAGTFSVPGDRYVRNKSSALRTIPVSIDASIGQLSSVSPGKLEPVSLQQLALRLIEIAKTQPDSGPPFIAVTIVVQGGAVIRLDETDISGVLVSWVAPRQLPGPDQQSDSTSSANR